ncbi:MULTISPECIES: Arc family DNA-binding protein [Pseudomonas]|uniref:Arc family DNA-binding protein n=1 Tax=Pseudomonas TaxID=286 RepID=UPI000761601F|nr:MULTISPECIES: Arc family DNA-binding protein [Pseudomonas]MDG9809479.1 Arc family DNA-binding protein [Pseudomonas juntendi]MDG9815836.1 Arc family DNA-binding protein [Pseudomonas putida]
MNPIAKNALKRAMAARLALPTSVLDAPEGPAAPAAGLGKPIDFTKPASVAPTPVLAPASALAPVEEVNPMQTAAQVAPVTPIRGKGNTARPGYNSRNADKFVIRLPDGVRERIKGHSNRGLYSMNTFIVRAAIKELDRLEGVETPMSCLEEDAAPAAGASTETMEALVLRLERAVARLERAQ